MSFIVYTLVFPRDNVKVIHTKAQLVALYCSHQLYSCFRTTKNGPKIKILKVLLLICIVRKFDFFSPRLTKQCNFKKICSYCMPSPVYIYGIKMFLECRK